MRAGAICWLRLAGQVGGGPAQLPLRWLDGVWMLIVPGCMLSQPPLPIYLGVAPFFLEEQGQRVSAARGRNADTEALASVLGPPQAQTAQTWHPPAFPPTRLLPPPSLDPPLDPPGL